MVRKRKPKQPDAQIIQGHVLDMLAGMKPESVSCCVTSPPYWSQRKYEAPDIVWGGKPKCKHRWVTNLGDSRGGSGPGAKETGNTYARSEQRGDTCSCCGAWRGQYGLEPTPELYVEHTLDVLRAIWRVLRPDGVVWWNVGDGYSHGGCGSRDSERWPKQSRNDHMPQHAKKQTGLKPKDLVLMPSRVALAAQAAGWYVRSVIIWHVINGLPESVKDRPTLAHEYILLLTKSAHYWWNAAEAREEAVCGADRNMRSVWAFPTAQTPKGATNYAAFPEELPRRGILASCPPDGLVLDPFAGVGTTGVVARRLGRRFVGIELSEKYCRMAATRMEQTTLGIPL